jgi:thioredoxin 1
MAAFTFFALTPSKLVWHIDSSLLQGGAMDTKESVVHVTDGSFDSEVLKSDQPTLVDFWAPWCGPCRAIGPIVEDLAKSYEGRVKIAKINVDDNQKTASTYGVQSIPMLILFKGGRKLDSIVGLVSKDRLESLIKKGL